MIFSILPNDFYVYDDFMIKDNCVLQRHKDIFYNTKIKLYFDFMNYLHSLFIALIFNIYNYGYYIKSPLPISGFLASVGKKRRN
jgi:hypothetical protein